MSDHFRVASFNVENLFGRAKVFNFQNHSQGDEILKKIDKFRELMKKAAYSSDDKKRMLELYNEHLKPYVIVREDRGKFFKRHGWGVVGIKADGVGEWDGAIEFKKAKFSEVARENTARVIKAVRADIACVVEAESRPMLKAFDTHLLRSAYKYEMLIDGNDQRGIDVGLYSKYPLGGIWTHIFEKDGKKTIFSRDCLEVELFPTENQPLYILCNHFKSRGYDYSGTADKKRKRQASRVAEILEKYNLAEEWVIVAGDLNDNPARDPLQPLLAVQNLFDVLELQFPDEPMKRWTYHYNNFEQIDYLLISKPLKDRFLEAGVERRGMYRLKHLTSGSGGLVETEEEFDTVTHWTNAASDHGAVWATFSL